MRIILVIHTASLTRLCSYVGAAAVHTAHLPHAAAAAVQRPAAAPVAAVGAPLPLAVCDTQR
jgi:hypothetical protein